MHITASRNGPARRGDARTGRRPPGRRKSHGEHAKQHEGEVRHPHHHERLGDTEADVALRNRSISPTASGEPIIAPPPNPMIANPVAIPGRSGNHLMSVDTGEM